MRVLTVMAVLVLAGCGVEGDPVRPKVGTVVTAGSGGNVSAGVGVKMGNVSASTTGKDVSVGVGVAL
ncbi:argininosuccinate lyase [Roseovarius autotrophicus]|uniref:argininosuccinate lyase n=1 Tax=Roseovarius autotrophicus TaxID=2824121 RepID=UPI0019F6FA32|nr:argininosuccinate lyase [Roseovarius autotrophicus]MBE0453469.1 argininosuccinate lyase [Roseovarius sp.]